MKNWIIAGLAVALVAVSVGAGVLAQASRTANVEVRVWEDVNDPERNFISARPEGGSWRTLGTIPLPLTDGVSSSGRFRYGDITLAVSLPGTPEPTATPDPTPPATATPSPTATTAAGARIGSSGNWIFRTNRDTLTGEKEPTALLFPDTKEWPYSRHHAAQLGVRCSQSVDHWKVQLCQSGRLPELENSDDCETGMGFEVFIDYGTYLGTDRPRNVSYRLDDGEVLTARWPAEKSPITGNTVLSVTLDRTLVHQLMQHTQFTIRNFDFSGIQHTMVFEDVRGLENVLPRMACY